MKKRITVKRKWNERRQIYKEGVVKPRERYIERNIEKDISRTKSRERNIKNEIQRNKY